MGKKTTDIKKIVSEKLEIKENEINISPKRISDGVMNKAVRMTIKTKLQHEKIKAQKSATAEGYKLSPALVPYVRNLVSALRKAYQNCGNLNVKKQLTNGRSILVLTRETSQILNKDAYDMCIPRDFEP